MAFSFLPKEDQYFTLFSQMTAKIQEAAGILVEMMQGPHENFVTLSKKIKSVEHECDEITHNVTTKLNKSFITPFDREDIYTLSVALDDVCDYIDAAARAVVMYDIHQVNDHSRQLALIIQGLANEIHAAVGMLKQARGMKQHLLEIQRLENDADEAYYKGIGDLFKNSKDPIEVIKLKELYEILENATDRCESVGNIIESIVLKHN
jgi:predicted phosphate transport protein (TIGR00153 family)